MDISKVVLLVLFLLLAIVSGMLSSWVVESTHLIGEEVFLMALLLILCVVPYYRSAVTLKLDIFEPLYILSLIFLLTYVIGPANLVIENNVKRNGIELREFLAPSIGLAIIGMIGVYAGYWWGAFQFGAKKQNPQEQEVSTLVEKHLFFRISVFGLVVTGSLFLLWLRLADFSFSTINYLTGSEEAYYSNVASVTSSATLYFYMFRLSWPILTLLGWSFAPNRFWRSIMVIAWIAAFLVYFFGASRGNLFVLISSTLIFRYLHIKKRPPLSILITFIVVTVIFSGLLVQLRSPSSRVRSQTESMSDILNSAMEDLGLRGTALGTMQVYSIFPEHEDYLGFEVITFAFINMIPRAVWPDKPANPRPVHMAIQPYAKDAHQLPAYDILAYYYAGFGVIGSIVSLFLFGAFSSLIYQAWKREITGTVPQLILAFWLPVLFINFHRGDLSFFAIQTGYTIGPVIVVRGIAKILWHNRMTPVRQFLST